MSSDEPIIAAAAIERERAQEMRLTSARQVLRVAAVLAVVAVIGWIMVATVNGGLIHGLALAASVGAPSAAVGLAAAALITTHRDT